MQRSGKDLAPGHWREILTAAGLSDGYLSGRHGPCPLCGGKDRFRFADQGSGKFFCGPCGHGDGWTLLMGILRCDFHGASQFVQRLLGDGSYDPRPMQARVAAATRNEPSTAQIAAKARELWASATPVAKGGAVDRYLRARIPALAGVPDSLRERVLDYWEAGPDGDRPTRIGTFPAMLAAIVDPQGALVNIHRTYLTEDGAKAAVSSPRKRLAGASGSHGAVRLADADDVLGVAEGIETALSAMALFNVPVWAALDTAGMKNFVVPTHVRRVRIFADHDGRKLRAGRNALIDPGLSAARALADRLRGQRLRATVEYVASVGKDFNDLATTT